MTKRQKGRQESGLNQRNVTGDNDGVTAIPGRGFNPVDTVEQGIGTAVASIDGVNAFQVGVVAKELHQNRLDRLGLVQDGLSADLESADRVGVDIVLLEQIRGNSEGQGVDVCVPKMFMSAHSTDSSD